MQPQATHPSETLIADPPRPDKAELIADGVVHAVGILLALIGLSIVAMKEETWTSTWAAVAVLGYATVLPFGLAISMTYNLWPEGQRKDFLRRCDHSAIFLLIAASYTPILQRSASHAEVQVMLWVIWGLALLGIAFKFVTAGRFHNLAIGIYLAMGWSGLLVLRPIAESVPSSAITLIVAGGAVYSFGVVFHLWERLRYQAAIWHGFVVMGSVVHFTAILALLAG